MAKRVRLNLLVLSGMVREMKLQAVRESRSIGRITEELWREYLKRKGTMSDGK